MPAYRGWQVQTQPDGSEIEIRQVGDEYYHYTVNRDGKQVKQNDEGVWEVTGDAPSEAEAQARHAAAKARRSPSRMPQEVGTTPNLAPRGIVILVNFANKNLAAGHTREVFDEMFNAEECTVNTYQNVNYPSAVTYFSDQSNGQYRPQFDVYGPVTLSKNYSYYGNNVGNEDEYATDAVIEGCILANEQYPDLNFADYDSDNDGYVDFVYVVYAGKGEADGGGANTIWPHNYSINELVTKYSTYTNYTLAQTKIDGVYLDNYAMSNEIDGQTGGLTGIGVLCHEFGHVMGMPDFYDTNYSTNYYSGLTPNDWDIMDGGGYNGGGHCPPNYSPWEKYFFGWITPENLGTEGRDITLAANGTEDYAAYQFNSSNSQVGATTNGLCYYIENRQQSGWDKFAPGHGMLVWKVNFSADAWAKNTPNNTANSPKYTIVSASGTRIGTGSNPFPGTAKKTSCTPLSDHTFNEISETNGVITCLYNGGAPRDEYNYTISGVNCTVPDNSVVTRETELTLTITPDEGYSLADAGCWSVKMGISTLAYGSGFSYDTETNTFSIASVTGDITITATGAQTVMWKAGGSVFATNLAIGGKLTLPSGKPESCAGYEFMGWTATENYYSIDTAPVMAENNSTASATVYYAVFAIKGGGSEQTEETYTFTSKNWDESTGTWNGTKSGYMYSSDKQGVQVSYSTSGAGANTTKEFDEVSKVTVKYCTNKSSGAGSITMSIDETAITKQITKTGGTTLRNLVFDFNNATGTASITVTCTTNSIYIHSISIQCGTGFSYSNYTTLCDTEGVEEVASDQPAARKVIRNGQIIIIRGDAVYSITGARIH